MKIILASNSPRRKELLSQERIDFDIVPARVKEEIRSNLTPKENVERLARIKCLEVFDRNPDSIVLAADTIVVFNNKIFGKPRDEKDAYDMLKQLQGKTHEVMTGVCVASKKGMDVSVTISKVTFFSMIDEEIYDYIKTGEPMDKAGAYAIQGLARKYIRSFDGPFDNIVGLPIDEVKRILQLHKG